MSLYFRESSGDRSHCFRLVGPSDKGRGTVPAIRGANDPWISSSSGTNPDVPPLDLLRKNLSSC